METVPLPLANPLTGEFRTSGSTQIAAPQPVRLWHLASRLWHLASLDAPTVAVVWSLAFARAAAVRLPAWVPVLLALGTFAVYVADRLLDAHRALRTGNVETLRERHYFHWRHRRVLAPLACIATAVAVTIVFTEMPSPLRERNSVLAVAALAYFSGVHLPRRPRWLTPLLSKELLVGLLFTAGCSLPTLTRLHCGTVKLCAVLAAMAVFATVAWLNCYAIDHWESARWDSAATTRLPFAATLLAVAGLLLAAVFFSTQPRVATLFAAASTSAVLLALLDRHRARLAPLALRTAADLALLTPAILLTPLALLPR